MSNTPYYVKAESDAISEYIKKTFASGIEGTVTPNVGGIPQINGVNITENGYYFVSANGDYGTITSVSISNNFVVLEVRNIETTAVYSKIDIPVNITIESTVIDGSTNAVSGNAVFDALVLKADKTNVLEKNNTTTFVPTAEYQPATKKYVDESQPNIIQNDWYDPDFINPYTNLTTASGLSNTSQDFAFLSNNEVYGQALVDGYNCYSFRSSGSGNVQLYPAFSKLFFNELGYTNGQTYKIGMWVKAPTATASETRTVYLNGFTVKTFNLNSAEWVWIESNNYTVDADDWQDFYFSVRYFTGTDVIFFRGLTLVNTSTDVLTGERFNDSFKLGLQKPFQNLYPFSQFIFPFNGSLLSSTDQNNAVLVKEITTLTGLPIVGNGLKFTYNADTLARLNYLPIISLKDSNWGTFQSMLPQIKKDVWLQIGFWVKVNSTLTSFKVSFNNEFFGGYGMNNIQANIPTNEWHFMKSIPILLGKDVDKKIINSQIQIESIVAPSDGSAIVIEVAGLTYGVSENKFSFKNDYVNNLANDNRFYTKKWTAYGDSITAYDQYPTWASQRLGTDYTRRAIGGSCCYNNGDIAWVDVNGDYIDRPPSQPPAGTEGVDYFEITASGCTQERINTIPLDTEILSFMFGMNDFGRNPTLGTINDAPSDAINGTFYAALKSMFIKSEIRISNAYKFVINVTHRKFEDTANTSGVYMWEFRKAIREVSALYAFPVVDVENIGINDENAGLYLADSVHPNWEMFRLIGSKVVDKLGEHQEYDFIKGI